MTFKDSPTLALRIFQKKISVPKIGRGVLAFAATLFLVECLLSIYLWFILLAYRTRFFDCVGYNVAFPRCTPDSDLIRGPLLPRGGIGRDLPST